MPKKIFMTANYASRDISVAHANEIKLNISYVGNF